MRFGLSFSCAAQYLFPPFLLKGERKEMKNNIVVQKVPNCDSFIILTSGKNKDKSCP